MVVAPKMPDLPPPHSPTMGHHSTNELLYGFCGDYPLSLTMSANDRAGPILKWFLPLQSATYMWAGGWKLHHPQAAWLFIYFSLCFSPLALKRHGRTRKGHRAPSRFLRQAELSSIKKRINVDVTGQISKRDLHFLCRPLLCSDTMAWRRWLVPQPIWVLKSNFVNDLHCLEW